jgi:acyl carrier protein phosphodiesterase
MNYLVHLHLSDPAPLCRLGNLMGDFVKGRLEERHWQPDLLAGLRQHRALDRYAHDHPAVLASKARLADRFGILKPVLVDIFYDHFLAKNWSRWADGSLEDFAAGIYRLLQSHEHLLVETFRPVARRMMENDWLVSYRDPEIIALVLERVGRRLKRKNLLAEGIQELERCGADLEQDCHAFLHMARRAEYWK